MQSLRALKLRGVYVTKLDFTSCLQLTSLAIEGFGLWCMEMKLPAHLECLELTDKSDDFSLVYKLPHNMRFAGLCQLRSLHIQTASTTCKYPVDAFFDTLPKSVASLEVPIFKDPIRQDHLVALPCLTSLLFPGGVELEMIMDHYVRRFVRASRKL